MAWAISLLLFGNWILGLASGAQLGQWVHLLLVPALFSLAMAVMGAAARGRAERSRRPPRAQGR